MLAENYKTHVLNASLNGFTECGIDGMINAARKDLEKERNIIKNSQNTSIVDLRKEFPHLYVERVMKLKR